MNFTNHFLHTASCKNFWAFCSVLTMAFLLSTASYADDAADITRLIELAEDHKATMTEFRQGTISTEEMRKRADAIKAEKNRINNAHGKPGSKERLAWDKQYKQAKREYDQKALQAPKSVEAQAPQPAKTYSQVHLPEEALIPMKTTDVQGIRYGMPRAEAEEILRAKGYQLSGRVWVLDDGQSRRSIEIGSGNLYLAGKDEKPYVFVVRYRQQFRPEIQFDTESIKQALLEKYGEPTNQSMHPVNGAGLMYQPEQPSYNVQAACTEEMNRRGTQPDSRKLEIHPMEYKAWQERGERDVKQRCPDQLNGFRQFMHFKLGIWASISANPYTKQIAIEWKDEGNESRKFRILKEEQFIKIDSGAKAKPSL